MDQHYHLSRKILKKYWQYPDFRHSQYDAIRSILSNNDTIVIFPTGSGKSLCFQIAALQFPYLTLVISPLIALMEDQVADLQLRNIPSSFIHHGITAVEMGSIKNQLIKNKIKLLYTSPERIQHSSFISLIKKSRLSMIVVDEAHCISQWGHDFRPNYARISEFSSHFENVPIMALTATATPHVENDIIKSLSLRKPRVFKKSVYRDNIGLQIINSTYKIIDILKILEKKTPANSAIIYCKYRSKCIEWAKLTKRKFPKTAYYHAGLSTQEKRSIQNQFARDSINIVFATSAFGMGINKPNIEIVIQSYLPPSIEEYVQQFGRAGRNGKPAHCYLLTNDNEVHKYQKDYQTINMPMNEPINTFKYLSKQTMSNKNTITIDRNTLNELSSLGIEHALSTIQLLAELRIIDVVQIHGSLKDQCKILTNTGFQRRQFSQIEIDVLEHLQRLYPELHHYKMTIEFNKLCTILNIEAEALYQVLIDLNEKNVIDYTPANGKYEVNISTILASSIKSKLKNTIKQKRKRRNQKAIIDYLYTKKCRMTYLMSYFGEKLSFNCHKCDNCIS